jgi:hypothetical protein
MVMDVGRLLERVVADVFGHDVSATCSGDPKSAHVRRVELRAEHDDGRTADLRASYEWFDVTIFDLGVSATCLSMTTKRTRKQPSGNSRS